MFREFAPWLRWLALLLFLVGSYAYIVQRARLARPVPLRIAAASDLQGVFPELEAAFTREYPEVPLDVTFGASGKLYSQIMSWAPLDVFLSADESFPRRLCEVSLAKPENMFPYAVGHLVVWVPTDSTLTLDKDGVQALLAPAVRKVAIANPKFAPYGRAAQAALEKLGVWEGVQDKLVLGDNIAQTAQFVESGAADAGLISLSLAQSPALKGQGRFWPVPADAHPPIRQVGVILDRASIPDRAKWWRAFLTGPRGRAILEKSGFTVE